MRDLPAGTVTFLFTDIEGSTRLLHEFGDRYADVLAEHRRALREAFGAHGGVEVDTQGDAFFVAFADAASAVAAAADAQTALDAGPVRVRMGVHTGEPTVTGEGYVGLDVHLAARVMAAGHGGQVVLSAETARGAERARLRDLGEHRLKDIERPVQLYQLGREDFPPLKTLNNSNVPVPPTVLLGRDVALADVLHLLRGERARLVTVTGAGGTGKTRFAIEVGRELIDDLPHGSWFVSLAALRDAALVVPTIASTLGAAVDLADHIGDKRMLLVLDNFEQVVAAAGDIAELMQRCANVQLVVTSREPLRITGEREYPLDPLAESPAVALFRARARALDPRFDAPDETLGAIAERLDRLPLALELAAARVRALSAEELLHRLEQRLPILTSRARDLPERQRTLRATIEWSYDLLSPDEQRGFTRLAVFAGSFDLLAAEHVAGADLDAVEALVERSLLRRWESGRIGMLETIREFAENVLDASEERDEIHRRHAEHYLAVAESANLSLEALGRAPQRHELVLPEQHNMRAAIDWATGMDVELGLRLCVALENFWVTHDAGEGARRFAALLERAADIEPVLHARALRDYGGTAQMAGDQELAARAYSESLARFRAAGDQRREAELIFRLGVTAFFTGDMQEGRRLHEESLAEFQRLGDTIGELQALGNLGWLDFEEGHRERGWERTFRSLEMCREVGWVWWEGGRLGELAERSLEEGLTNEGERHAVEFLEIARRTGDGEASVGALALLAWAAAQRGEVDRSIALWSAVEAETGRRAMPRWQPFFERYAAHIPDGPRPDAAMNLDEAAQYALGAADA